MDNMHVFQNLETNDYVMVNTEKAKELLLNPSFIIIESDQAALVKPRKVIFKKVERFGLGEHK